MSGYTHRSFNSNFALNERGLDISQVSGISINNPQSGDILQYNTTTNLFENSAFAGGGAVDSVNSYTGVVVLNPDDLDDTSTAHKFVSSTNITDWDTTKSNFDSHVLDLNIHFAETSIDHVNILNKGTNTHAQIDSHISDSSIHPTNLGSISNVDDTSSQGQILRKGVTNWQNENLTASIVEMEKITGSTYSTAQHSHNIMGSSGLTETVTITDNLDGSVDIGATKGFIRQLDDTYNNLLFFDIASQAGIVLPDLTLSYVYINYNGGTPIYQLDTVLRNNNQNILLGTIYRRGTDLHIRRDKHCVVDHAINNILRIEADGYKRTSGAELGKSSRNFTIASSEWYYGTNKIIDSGYNSAIDTFRYLYYNGAVYVQDSLSNQIDNLQFEDTGVLTTLGGGKRGVHYIYAELNQIVKRVVVIYGNQEYGSLLEAEESKFPDSSLFPSWMYNYIPIGKAIIVKSASVIEKVLNVDEPVTVTASLQLNNLSDVNTATNTLGHTLVYNNVSSMYENNFLLSQYVKQNKLLTPSDDSLRYFLNSFNSSSIISGGVVSINGGDNSKIDVSSGECVIRQTNSDTATIYTASFPSKTALALTNNSMNYIYIEVNGSSPQIVKSVSVLEQNTNILIARVYRENTTLYIDQDHIKRAVNQPYNQLTKDNDIEISFSRVSGLVPTKKGGSLGFDIPSGVVYSGYVKRTTTPYDTAITQFKYIYFSGTWQVANVNLVSASQYNNSGTLTNMTTDYYKSDYLYYNAINGSVVVVYGYSEENTLNKSFLNQPPSVLPPWMYNFKFIAKLIIKEGNTEINYIQSVYDTPLQRLTDYEGLDIVYDNTASTLISTNVQDAISELDTDLDNHVGTSNIHYLQSAISIPIGQLSDVTDTTPSSGHVFVRDGSVYNNRKLTFDDMNQTGTIQFVSNGTAGSPALRWASDVDSGLYFSGNPIFSHSGVAVQEWKSYGIFINQLLRFNSKNNATPTIGDIWRDNVDNELYYENGSGTVLLSKNSIGSFSDVDITGAVDGKILKWQTDKFVISDDLSGGSGTIDGLTDTTITSRAANEFLKVNPGNTAWINTTIQASDLPSHNHVKTDITDLTNETLTITSGGISLPIGSIGTPSLRWTNCGAFEPTANTLAITTDFVNENIRLTNTHTTFNDILSLTPIANSGANNEVWIDSTTNRLHVYTNSKNVNLPPIISTSEADKHVMIYNNANTQYENRVLSLVDISDGDSRVTALESNNVFTSDIEKNESMAQFAVTSLPYNDADKAISYIDLSTDTFVFASGNMKTNDGDFTVAEIQDGDNNTGHVISNHPGGAPKTRRFNLDLSSSITINAMRMYFTESTQDANVTISAATFYGSNNVNTYTETDPAILTSLTSISAVSGLRNTLITTTFSDAGPYRYYSLILTSDTPLDFQTFKLNTYQVRQIAGGLSGLLLNTDFLLNRQTDGVIEYKSIRSGTNAYKINVSNAIDFVMNRDILPVVLDKKRLYARSTRKQCYKNIAVAPASPYTITKDSEGYINDAYALVDTTGAYTINLPDIPVDGEIVEIYDYTGNASVQNITVNPSGTGTIDTLSSYTMNVNNQSRIFTYDSENDDWVSSATSPVNSIVIHNDDSILLCDTTTTAFTAYLPASLTQGVTYLFKDSGGNGGTNNITINSNSNLIDGFAGTKVINTNYGSIKILDDGTQLWVI